MLSSLLGLLESADRRSSASPRSPAAAGLTVSTTHRLLKALAAAGLVGPGPRHRALPPRRRARSPSAAAPRCASGSTAGTAQLQRLAAETGESASLGTRLGNEVLIADHVPSAQALRFDAGIGPAGADPRLGDGQDAARPEADDPAAEVAALGELERFTDRTLTDPAALAAELDTIRRRGWSLNDGERNPGVRAVAVAIPHGRGRIAAAWPFRARR